MCAHEVGARSARIGAPTDDARPRMAGDEFIAEKRLWAGREGYAIPKESSGLALQIRRIVGHNRG